MGVDTPLSRPEGYINEIGAVPQLATCLRFPRGPTSCPCTRSCSRRLAMAEVAAEAGDDGTNDVIVSDVVRRSEWQVWFVAGHRADTQHSYRQCRCRCRGRVDRPTRLIEPGARASIFRLTHQRFLACSPRKTKQVERAFATCLPS